VEVLASVGAASRAVRGAFESPAAPDVPCGGPAGFTAGGAETVGICDGDGALCDTAGAFTTADASPPTAPEDAYDFDGVAGERASEYELLWTGTRIWRPGRLTMRVPPPLDADGVPCATDRCATRVGRPGVVVPALGTERAAAMAAARSSFGTATVGNRATGVATAGISIAAVDGWTIDLTVANTSVA
jgi:hypothetical protein